MSLGWLVFFLWEKLLNTFQDSKGVCQSDHHMHIPTAFPKEHLQVPVRQNLSLSRPYRWFRSRWGLCKVISSGNPVAESYLTWWFSILVFYESIQLWSDARFWQKEIPQTTCSFLLYSINLICILEKFKILRPLLSGYVLEVVIYPKHPYWQIQKEVGVFFL